MKLSAPIHILKRRAKLQKRAQNISLSMALNQIAIDEGFKAWSHLQAKAEPYTPQTATEILQYLSAGDMLLLGARPNLGKTVLSIEILSLAVAQKRNGFFYSLEFTEAQTNSKISNFGTIDSSLLKLNFSDEICASYIIDDTKGSNLKDAIIVIDYLQILDQNRKKTPLQNQIKDLKAYAAQTGCIFIFISQIDRVFESQDRLAPTLADVRLPNPLDLTLFNKSIFI